MEIESLETYQNDSAPEVVIASPDLLAGWLANGRLADLNPYLADPALGLQPGEQGSDLAQNFSPVFWQQDALPDGSRRSGIPAVRTARVLFYNQTWAEELGFQQPPRTPDEFKAQACAAAKANSEAYNYDLHGTGGWLVDHDALTALSWLAAFGANPIPGDSNGAYQFESKEAEQALSFLNQLMIDGCAWEGKNPVPYDYFSHRMALFYAGSLQDLSVQSAEMARQGDKDQWLVIPFPVAAGSPFVLSSGYSFGILRTNPLAQEAGWLFVRWMAQPHNQALLGEVWLSLPPGAPAARQLTDYTQHFPWTLILPLQDQVAAGPSLGSWRVVRGVLEDAAWQIFRLPGDQVQYILPQVDEISKELLSRK